MQSIYLKQQIIVLLGVLSIQPLLAKENNNIEIDMAQLELFYKDQQQLEQQYQNNVEPQQIEEDIRARRLREWHEQNPTQPVAMTPNNDIQSIPPEADDLFAAATDGNTAKIGALLAQGLDINTSNGERETALHMAAARGHYSTVIYLINNGAYANAPTIKNWIPLHHAVRFRHPNIANFLVKRGSSPSVRTSDGLSAVDMAKAVNDYRLLSILGAR